MVTAREDISIPGDRKPGSQVNLSCGQEPFVSLQEELINIKLFYSCRFLIQRAAFVKDNLNSMPIPANSKSAAFLCAVGAHIWKITSCFQELSLGQFR